MSYKIEHVYTCDRCNEELRQTDAPLSGGWRKVQYYSDDTTFNHVVHLELTLCPTCVSQYKVIWLEAIGLQRAFMGGTTK